MRKNRIELFMSYVLNYRDFLENQIRVMQQNLRYRKIDTMDCVELMLLYQQLIDFKEYTKNSIALLGLNEKEFEKNDL